MESNQLTPISPTYLSSDLLSPSQLRKTTPNVGFQPVERPPLGGHTWGENVTNYGGIGKLDFLGKARARDLYVSRSHRHFSSGFSIYENADQPQQLTPLLKSGCRINDQLIPPPFQVSLDPVKYTYPQKWPVNPYFSHTSKFEVLPKHDQSRSNDKGGPVLNEVTRDALANYYYTVYDQPRYNMCYPDNTEVIKERVAAGQLKAEIPEKTAPEQNPVQKCEEVDGDRKEQDLWVMSLIEGVISDMGPIRQHCCFRDILLKIFEYEGASAVRTCLDTFFTHCDQLMSCDMFLRYFGDNAGHIQQEIAQLKTSLGNDIRKIVDIIEVAWTFGNSIRNMTDFQAFQCLLGKDNSGCKGKQDIGCVKKDAADPLAKEKQSPAEMQEAYLQRLRDTLDRLTNKPDAKQGVSQASDKPCSDKKVEGVAPVWPPGSYITNKPWMSLQSTLAYPTRYNEVSKRRKTNVNSALSGFVEPLAQAKEAAAKAMENGQGLNILPRTPPEGKKVTFADENQPGSSTSYPSRAADEAIKEKFSACHGLPRYTEYLNDIIPSPIDGKSCKNIEPICHKNISLDTAALTEQASKTPLTSAKDVAFPSLPRSEDMMQDGGKKRLPPLAPGQPKPLSQCLEPTGNRIQDHLGLSFKTQAHKRFHQLYPDKIPDLRDNVRFRKRNFFQGYHGSAFRGNTQREVINAHA